MSLFYLQILQFVLFTFYTSGIRLSSQYPRKAAPRQILLALQRAFTYFDENNA